MARKNKKLKPPEKVFKSIENRDNYHTDIYIPNHFLEYNPCFLICALSRNNFHHKINAIFAVHNVKHLLKLVNKMQIDFTRNIEMCIGVVGDEKLPNSLHHNNNFVIKITLSKLHVERVFYKDIPFPATHLATLITYKSHKILDCDSLGLQEEEESESFDRMIDFLNYTFTLTKSINRRLALYTVVKQSQHNDIISCVASPSAYLKCIFLYIILLALQPFQNVPTEKLPQPIHKGINITATGRQVLRKFKEIKNLHKDLQSKELSLKCGNLMAALLVDAICGVVLMYILRDYLNPEEVFASILEMTEAVVNQLQILLNWLMGVPAGLKLNRPLNIVLGRFFLYHIYLWKTYIVVLKPFLLIALENSTLVGVFGVSFLLSFASDFISLATIHIYCFYGYAAKLYNFNITGLVALWRLFCGKKWNPLRNRVDSYTYDVQQLFIGTLMFTVLIFLLPTVIVYYVVFTTLRVIVLSFQLGIAKMVELINTMPIYVMYLRLISHPYIKGDVHFQVVSNVENTVHLYMESKPSSWLTLLSKTRPDSLEHNVVTWTQLGYNLLRGNIIYPL